ncbi:hypothetical protein AVEN_217533-1 [Araneus ventricosus]|uniref:CCHC-type domain-containing protein n=1 Tax=Araneus ventricosus TaxID=182803 RepID=A0A4Y2M5U9_ARAVE|nr:hypothetical protein AVEN_217533-1 [Araneus ventricosus]
MAVQLPSEKVRDFATRIEGLALNSFGEKAVGKDEMSTKLREKMVLSQFMAGLQPRIKAQMIVENPESFSAAMELGERIETAQSMLTPNVNVLNVKESHSEKVLEAVRASGETVEKTLDLLCRQLDSLNSRLDKIEREKREQPPRFEPATINQRPPVRCFSCQRIGHFARDCRLGQIPYEVRGFNHQQFGYRGRGQNQRGSYRGNFSRGLGY